LQCGNRWARSKRTWEGWHLDNKWCGSALEPKQDRSRASFERVLDAATTLLSEKGYSEFTLQELEQSIAGIDRIGYMAASRARMT
jgi:hypothetical protein